MRQLFKIKTFSFLCGGLLLAGTWALAAEVSYTGKTELGLRLGGLFFEGDSQIKDTGVAGVGLGHYLDENWAVEAAIVGGHTKDNKYSPTGTQVILPTVEGQYHFGQGALRPFVALGFGFLDYNRKSGPDSTHFAPVWGGGAKWLFTDSLAARADARHVIDAEGGIGTNNLLLTAGLSWLMGGEPRRAEPVIAAAPKISDADNDGVADIDDACPNTPAGTAVNDNGCSKDSDGDGVTDDKDDCPGTPPSTPVDEKGCPKKVEEVHVVPEKEWVLRGVHFEMGSGYINPKSFGVLDEAVAILKENPTVTIEIQGHTDNIGTPERNQKLSQLRAEAVKKYLVSKGVAASRLTAKGFGQSSPVAENTIDAGRAANRRIEFKVLSR